MRKYWINVLKKILLSDRPLPKNYNNPGIPKKPLPLEFKYLDSAKSALIDEVELFEKYFEADKDLKLTNVTFGDLNFEEWCKFHLKHFSHHFGQFGVKK